MGVQPIENARIEIIKLLEVEGVACIVVEMSIAIGDSASDFVSHPHWGEDIVLAANDEAGLENLPELIDYVVFDAGSRLPF